MNVLGVDLAWGLGRTDGRPPHETGVVALATDGRVSAAGWTVTLDETVAWIEAHGEQDCVLFVDAPLLVENERGQRTCETQVGQRYGRWKVSANSSNLGLPHSAGVALRTRLEECGWRYDDGHDGPSLRGRTMSECYPYTTIVGSPALGYDVARPTYKRKPRALPTSEWRAIRAAACDGLIAALATLTTHDPPLDLRSHPVTRVLVDEPSPEDHRAYKHREDLLDAAIAAWSAAVWVRHGFDASQVLGDLRGTSDGSGRSGGSGSTNGAGESSAGGRPAATIIAPARPEQRRP